MNTIFRRASLAALLLSLAALALRGEGRPAARPPFTIAGAAMPDASAPQTPGPSTLEAEVQAAFGDPGLQYLKEAGDAPELWGILGSPARLDAARELARLHGAAPALDFMTHLVRAALKPNFNSLKSFPATRHSGNRPKWPIGAGFRLGLSPNLVQTI